MERLSVDGRCGRVRSSIILSLCLLILSCSNESTPSTFDPEMKAKEQASKERAADRAAVKAGFQPDAPAPIPTLTLDPPKTDAPGAILPPADSEYRYLGRWAATPALCANGAWQFSSRKLTTAGETACDFTSVATVPVGYRLEAVCQSEGTKTEQTLRLSFDDGEKTMTVRGRTLGPATLIYCGE